MKKELCVLGLCSLLVCAGQTTAGAFTITSDCAFSGYVSDIAKAEPTSPDSGIVQGEEFTGVLNYVYNSENEADGLAQTRLRATFDGGFNCDVQGFNAVYLNNKFFLWTEPGAFESASSPAFPEDVVFVAEVDLRLYGDQFPWDHLPWSIDTTSQEFFNVYLKFSTYVPTPGQEGTWSVAEEIHSTIDTFGAWDGAYSPTPGPDPEDPHPTPEPVPYTGPADPYPDPHPVGEYTTPPNVPQDCDYKINAGESLIINTLLEETILFDLWWDMKTEPPPYQQGCMFDVLALQSGAGWQFIGQTTAYNGTNGWQTVSFTVPEHLRGESELRLVLTDYYPETRPTVYIRTTHLPVPEPASLMLLGLGALGMMRLKRQK